MATDKVWRFKDLKTKREALYGNVRELSKSETIIVDNVIISEYKLRRLLEQGQYIDENVSIKKMNVQRSKFKKS